MKRCRNTWEAGRIVILGGRHLVGWMGSTERRHLGLVEDVRIRTTSSWSWQEASQMTAIRHWNRLKASSLVASWHWNWWEASRWVISSNFKTHTHVLKPYRILYQLRLFICWVHTWTVHYVVTTLCFPVLSPWACSIAFECLLVECFQVFIHGVFILYSLRFSFFKVACVMVND